MRSILPILGRTFLIGTIGDASETTVTTIVLKQVFLRHHTVSVDYADAIYGYFFALFHDTRFIRFMF